MGLHRAEEKSAESGVQELKPRSLVFVIVSYSLCSSTLLLVNKLVLQAIPAPSTMLAAQCFFTAFAVRSVCIVFPRHVVEKISKEDLRLFVVVVACFVGTLFSNAKALQFTNVDTVIGLRLTMPLVTSVLEYAFLGRELPNRRSSLALLGVAGSFSFYIFENGSLSSQCMFWLGFWYSWTIIEGIFVKHVVTVSKLSTLSKTYYLNLFSSLVFACMACIWEYQRIAVPIGTAVQPILLSLSCCLGFGMSYLSFLLRQEISATTFNIIGNVCKVLTIGVNSFVWNLHASPAGTASIIICIGCTTIYSQAPMRKQQESLSSEHVGDVHSTGKMDLR